VHTFTDDIQLDTNPVDKKKKLHHMHTCFADIKPNPRDKTSNPPTMHSPTPLHLSPRSLEQLHMLLWVGFLDVALRNLLHHEIGINFDFFAQLPVRNAPFSRNGEYADGGFGVDEGVDT
jgi:hypothetical protein